MKISFTMIICVAVAILCGCESGDKSKTDDPNKINDESKEGLFIEVSSQSLSIDDGESVDFTVLFNGEDVSADAEVINITDGAYAPLSSTNFTTLRPGVHTFFATYGKYSSDKVSVMATSESNVSSIYYRHNVIFKHTATWCSYCPRMSTAISFAEKEYPDRLIEVEIHHDDELATGASVAYNVLSGYPTAMIDLNKKLSTTMTSSSLLVEYAKQSTQENPTVVGIKMENAVVDNMLTIDVEASFQAVGKYKIAVALLQSGFALDQAGTQDPEYRQNKVLRGFFQEDVMGDYLGEMIAGERKQLHYEYELPAELSTEDYELYDIAVWVLNDVGNAIYQVNNGVECGLQESVDYRFEPIVE